jgi:hypothetical protein
VLLWTRWWTFVVPTWRSSVSVAETIYLGLYAVWSYYFWICLHSLVRILHYLGGHSVSHPDSSTGSLNICYRSFRTINFSFLPYSVPVIHIIEWHIKADFNAISHEYHALIFNRKPSPLYRHIT